MRKVFLLCLLVVLIFPIWTKERFRASYLDHKIRLNYGYIIELEIGAFVVLSENKLDFDDFYNSMRSLTCNVDYNGDLIYFSIPSYPSTGIEVFDALDCRVSIYDDVELKKLRGDSDSKEFIEMFGKKRLDVSTDGFLEMTAHGDTFLIDLSRLRFDDLDTYAGYFNLIGNPIFEGPLEEL